MGEEQRRTKVKDTISKQQNGEQRRLNVKNAISKKQKREEERCAEVKEANSEMQAKDTSEDAVRLKALTLARSKVEQARDPSEIFGALNMSTSKKMASLVRKGYPLGCGSSSDKVLMKCKGLQKTTYGKKMVAASTIGQEESIRRVHY